MTFIGVTAKSGAEDLQSEGWGLGNGKPGLKGIWRARACIFLVGQSINPTPGVQMLQRRHYLTEHD